jgi:hypothetical protein
MELTVYKADFTVECWHEFYGRCGWLEYEQCLCILFNQKLKRENHNAYDEGPEILRCKTCITFCANMPREDMEE